MGANIPSLAVMIFALFLVAAGILVLRRRSKLSIVLCALWMAGLLVAAGAMSSRRETRAAVQAPLERWPTASRLVRDSGAPTLVMFAHPYCECTKASLAELRELAPRLEGKVRSYILFARSAKESVESSRSENRILAESIHGVTIVDDQEAREADRFGATTSGQIMLFDAGGEVLFTGGIGPLPHYAGRSPMLLSLIAAIESLSGGGPMGARVQMPNAVFGCELHGKGNAPRPIPRTGS
jgi:hypothetical protein